MDGVKDEKYDIFTKCLFYIYNKNNKDNNKSVMSSHMISSS